MAQVYGVENLKKLLKFSCDLTKQIATALEDGKFTWPESLGFVDEVAEIPGVVKSFPAIQKELSELSEDERKELVDYFAQEFDLPNDKAELNIEHALSVAIGLVALVETWNNKSV